MRETSDSVEDKIRAILKSGKESDKVEFKETYPLMTPDGKINKVIRAELIRDVMALANAVSIDEDQTGYLLLGVTNNASPVDNYTLFCDDSAQLQDLINGPMQRKIRFEYRDFSIGDGKTIGVIVIPESQQRPHMILHDCLKDSAGWPLLRAGECWIRSGTQKRKALAEDYDTIYESVNRRRIQEAIAAHLKASGQGTGSDAPVTRAKPKEIIRWSCEQVLERSQELLAEGAVIRLRQMVEELSRFVVREWRQAIAKPTVKSISAVRDGVLIPNLEKLLIMSVEGAKYEQMELLLEVGGAFARIYELSNLEYGISPSGEHLTHTVPSKQSTVFVYALGAFLTSKDNVAALSRILRVKVSVKAHQNGEVHLVSHPRYDSYTGEGDLTKFFDAARELLAQNPMFKSWFHDNEELVLNSLVQFDFIAKCFLHNQTDDHGPEFPNFKRFYKFRLEPYLGRVFASPEQYVSLFGEDPVEGIRSYLKAIKGQSGLIFHSWLGEGWRFPQLEGLE